ncbi:GL26936 [Drosophila persimilis]|uniref:GL26936 n=1 Tax=Drosophila persimilis TaxID=7234 RepID=B4HC80_DROPE|nr:GL26936 [Drosophila persimilis]
MEHLEAACTATMAQRRQPVNAIKHDAATSARAEALPFRNGNPRSGTEKSSQGGLLNQCLREGVFPVRWKIQKQVLIPKPGKLPGSASSYNLRNRHRG